MKRKGKVVLGMFVVVMIFAIGASLLMAEAKKEKSLKGITLRWITGPHATTDAVLALLPEFENETGIKVIPDIMDEEREFTKITTEFAAGSLSYDVISVRDTDIPTFIDMGIIRPIDDLINLDILPVPGCDIEDYPPALFETMCRWYGKIWGFPYLSGATFLAYRKDWFEKDGIAPPTTWNKLLKAAEHFTKGGRYGFVFRASRGHHAAYAWYTTTMYAFGADHFNYDTMMPTYNTPRSVESLEMLIKLGKYCPPGYVSFSHEEAVSSYVKGIAAMLSEADLLIPWVEGEGSEAAGNTEYLVMPKAYDDVKLWAGNCGWLWTIPTTTKEVEAAMIMLEYFTSKRNEKKMVLNGGIAQRMSTMSDPEILSRWPWYKHVMEAEKVGKWPHPITTESTAVNVIVGTHVNAALIGQEKPQDALNKANKEVYELLKEKGIYNK